jgi:Icc-related predicted phosphoesterase
MSTKVVLISDTHCRLRKVVIPEGDILIHAGDLTFQGNVAEISQELRELERIAKNFKAVYFTPGNHDWMAEYNPSLFKQMCKDVGVVFLHDEWAVYDGLVIYGSGWTPEFCDWALNVPRGPKLAEKWAQIPDKVDILVTHGPPAGILDLVPYGGERAGCEDLFKRVMQVKPQLHVFGHIHHSYGVQHFDGITFVNAATCTERYKPTNEPIVIELE